jgi:hypothetical protein
MTEQDTNVQGDCLNMSECGIYENGTSIVPLRPLMINSKEKAMGLTWISGYSDLECISDQSRTNLSIERYERTSHSTKKRCSVCLRISGQAWRLGEGPALLVSGGGEEICLSKAMVRLSNGCVRIN